MKYVYSLLVLLLSFASLSFADPLSPEDMDTYLKSEKRVIVYGEQFIDFGEFAKSNQLLSEAVKRYSANDVILSLYGKSLYESGQKDLAEDYFMQALRLNAANIIAQQYIEQIRDVRSLSVSEESQELSSMIKDKVGDLVVFVISIWLGTSLNTFWRFLLMKWRWRNAKASYMREDYDDVVRILEMHVMEMEQDAIDETLHFMLSSGQSQETVNDIIEKYIVREECLAVLKRSLVLLVESDRRDEMV